MQVNDRSPVGHRLTSTGGTSFTTLNQRGGRSSDLAATGTSSGRQAQLTGIINPYNFYDRSVPFTAECFIRPDSATVAASNKTIMGV